ncbi:MAG: hypothetical protein NWR41_03215, partial [Rickettsiaceae bacterium]|nr:hypothetical protein [Rickettsiaceae bacterium]
DTKAEEKLALPSGFDEAVEAPTEPTESAVDNTDTPAEEKLALPSGFDDAEKTSIESTDTTEGDTDTPAEEKLALPSGFDENEKGKSEDDDITDVTIPGPETTVSSESLLESPSQDDDVSKLELPALASAVAENDEFAVPSYVSEIDTKKTSEDDISKYTKELQEKQKTLTPVDKISEAELATGNNVIEQYTEITSASLDKTQLEFVNNEAQVLILPNDDIVLGELTEEAKFNLIDLRSYAQIFWDKYYQMQREPERRVIEDFIKNYDDNFGNEEYLYSANIIATGMKEAFKSIDKDNIYSLIAILNSYPVLQLTGDGDNTLLHEASYVGNYSAARLLVLKGIDIFAKNENNQTALNVAEKFNNQHIVFLLKSANLK